MGLLALGGDALDGWAGAGARWEGGGVWGGGGGGGEVAVLWAEVRGDVLRAEGVAEGEDGEELDF